MKRKFPDFREYVTALALRLEDKFEGPARSGWEVRQRRSWFQKQILDSNLKQLRNIRIIMHKFNLSFNEFTPLLHTLILAKKLHKSGKMEELRTKIKEIGNRLPETEDLSVLYQEAKEKIPEEFFEFVEGMFEQESRRRKDKK